MYDLGELAGETTVPGACPPSEVIQTGESLGIASDSLTLCLLSKFLFCLALNFSFCLLNYSIYDHVGCSCSGS